MLGRVVQSGGVTSIPAQSHTFVEIDHKKKFYGHSPPSAVRLKNGLCQLHVKVCAQSTG